MLSCLIGRNLQISQTVTLISAEHLKAKFNRLIQQNTVLFSKLLV